MPTQKNKTAEAVDEQALRFVDADELRGWETSLEGVTVLSLKDENLGGLDGLLVGENDRPFYLVVLTSEQPSRRVLLPVGTAWFDETSGAIRTDADQAAIANHPVFDQHSYDEMTPEESWAYERRVLQACCPEALTHPGGRLDYYRHLPHFRPPAWVAPPRRPADSIDR